ncbi:hypothetical protein COLO4_24964 [Corchorus olitorius]|uniref:DUF7769 domain-containing protein n=1 Tax=Corchorus olitorius TaxID=93759 RepID=A0A1R3I5L1_9ROSI|nr:hypothetical protein COLO4_24964 [Corchorus olitorius]
MEGSGSSSYYNPPAQGTRVELPDLNIAVEEGFHTQIPDLNIVVEEECNSNMEEDDFDMEDADFDAEEAYFNMEAYLDFVEAGFDMEGDYFDMEEVGFNMEETDFDMEEAEVQGSSHKRRYNMLSNEERMAIYRICLENSNYGKLKDGTKKMLASSFGVCTKSIQRLWKRAKETGNVYHMKTKKLWA